jgi:hypothetical protein
MTEDEEEVEEVEGGPDVAAPPADFAARRAAQLSDSVGAAAAESCTSASADAAASVAARARLLAWPAAYTPPPEAAV